MSTSPSTNPAAESRSLIARNDHLVLSTPGGGYHGATPAGRAVANWHDETHAGAFSFCDQQPCDAVRRVGG